MEQHAPRAGTDKPEMFLGFVTLSEEPPRRELQRTGALMGVAGIALLLVFGGLVLFSGDLADVEPGTRLPMQEARGWVALHWVATVLALAAVGRLAWAVLRDREAVRRTPGVLKEYRGFVLVSPILWSVFNPWPAYVVHAVLLVYLLVLRPAPQDETD